jgi:hypothetical protein
LGYGGFFSLPFLQMYRDLDWLAGCLFIIFWEFPQLGVWVSRQGAYFVLSRIMYTAFELGYWKTGLPRGASRQVNPRPGFKGPGQEAGMTTHYTASIVRPKVVSVSVLVSSCILAEHHTTLGLGKTPTTSPEWQWNEYNKDAESHAKHQASIM